MALIATDGFDAYNGTGANTGAGAKWALSGGTYSLATGRFGGQCLSLQVNTSGAKGDRNFASTYTSACVGFAFKSNLLSNTSNGGFVYFRTGNTAQVGIGFTSTGALQLVTATGSYNVFNVPNSYTLGASGTAGDLSVNVWQYIEIAITANASTGTITVYVDGVSKLALTGINTLPQTTGGYDSIEFMCSQSSGSPVFLYDDYYEGSTTTPIGPMRMDILRPASDYAVQFTPNSGANNYSRVNETLADGDTSYVSSGTTGQSDLYGLGTLPVTPTSIVGVQAIQFAEKTDVNPRSLYLQLKSGSTTDQGSAIQLATGYQRLERMVLNDPNTSAAWTAAAVNTLLTGPYLAS